MDNLLIGRRILVVEDEMLILMMTEDLLEANGCKSVSAAATVAQALALIASNGFDVAVLDMNLNGDSSQTVADALAEKGVPFVFVTGHARLSTPDAHSQRPKLTKPYEPQKLVQLLAELTAFRGAAD